LTPLDVRHWANSLDKTAVFDDVVDVPSLAHHTNKILQLAIRRTDAFIDDQNENKTQIP
jgi:hypothetical protein